MHRRLQFGMRESPASEQRHGSRFAISTKSSPNSGREKNAEALGTLQLAELTFTDAHISPRAATNQAATVWESSDASRLLTIRDVAELLQVPVSWVYEHTRRRAVDRMPGFRLGKYWRFNEADVRTWLRQKIQK